MKVNLLRIFLSSKYLLTNKSPILVILNDFMMLKNTFFHTNSLIKENDILAFK
jgi:hypothetical protein